MKAEYIKTKFSKFVKVKIRSFDNFRDDFSNSLYIINDAYLIRDSAALKDPLVSYKHEKNFIDHLEDTDISEKIIYHSSINGFKIARFIKMSKVFSEVNEASIHEYIRTLKKLTKLEIKNLPIFNLEDAINIYKSKCDASDYLDSAYEQKIFKALAQDKLPKVNSHSNVEKIKVRFLENKVKIADFRYGCLNSPLFDLAYFSNTFELSEKDDKFMLNKYFGYKMKIKYIKLFAQYKKYIDMLRYYRNSYYYTVSGEISYLDIRNTLKNKIN